MYSSIADLADWSEKATFWGGKRAQPCAQCLRIHGVFRTSHRLHSGRRLRASLAPGKIKHTKVMAQRRVCRHHFEAAPEIGRLNLAGANLEHDASPWIRREHTTLSVTDGCQRLGR